MSYPQKQVNDLLNDSGFPSRLYFFLTTLLRRLAVVSVLLGACLPQESKSTIFLEPNTDPIGTPYINFASNIPQSSADFWTFGQRVSNGEQFYFNSIRFAPNLAISVNPDIHSDSVRITILSMGNGRDYSNPSQTANVAQRFDRYNN